MSNTARTQKITCFHPALRIVSASLAIALSSLLVACGGGNGMNGMNPGSNPSPTPASTTSLQVNMGDAPADWILAFSMSISSMSLSGTNGSVSVITSTVPMEMMHTMGTMQPLAMVSVPQGLYTSASINISSVAVTYINPTKKTVIQTTIPGPIIANVNFSNSMNVGSTPMAIGFDLDLANSITMDPSGNISMNPTFHASTGMQGSGNPADPANGGIQQMMGTVSSMSGNSFLMASLQAAQLFTFQTNSSTAFDGNGTSNMGMMTNGMIMLVDANLQPDGSLLATRAHSMMNAGGMMGSGVLTAVSGKPATQLTVIMQNGAGTGMMATSFAAGVTVDVNGSTVYNIDSDGIDMSSLPFTPLFDANNIYSGQSAQFISSRGLMTGGMGGGMMGGGTTAGTITASEINLEPQGLSGTSGSAITSGARSSFTLTLPSDSAFSTLTGATSVVVYQQPGTVVTGTSPIASGATVRTRGLLFFDSGRWKMVTTDIASN